VYDDPWYWIVLENKAKKQNPSDRKPRIEISDARQLVEHPLADPSTMQLVHLDYVHELECENQRLVFENDELRMQILARDEANARLAVRTSSVFY